MNVNDHIALFSRDQIETCHLCKLGEIRLSRPPNSLDKKVQHYTLSHYNGYYQVNFQLNRLVIRNYSIQ